MIQKTGAQITYDFSAIDQLDTLKSYIYSIFQNLIVNSIKYSRLDTEPLISIKSEVSGKMITLSFRDNGKGIDLKKNGQALFGLYKRFDKTVEGKGMGLFMVKSQVESLSGTIKVKSEINKGSCFCIELPLTD